MAWTSRTISGVRQLAGDTVSFGTITVQPGKLVKASGASGTHNRWGCDVTPPSPIHSGQGRRPRHQPCPQNSLGHMLAPRSEGAGSWLDQVLFKQLSALFRKVEVSVEKKRGAATAGAAALRGSVHHGYRNQKALTEPFSVKPLTVPCGGC